VRGCKQQDRGGEGAKNERAGEESGEKKRQDAKILRNKMREDNRKISEED